MHHLRAFGRLLDDLDDQAEEDTLEGFMRQGTQVEPDREGAGGPRPVTEAGVEHRFVESRDGHNWINWRDHLRDGLTWVFPGHLWMTYD